MEVLYFATRQKCVKTLEKKNSLNRAALHDQINGQAEKVWRHTNTRNNEESDPKGTIGINTKIDSMVNDGHCHAQGAPEHGRCSKRWKKILKQVSIVAESNKKNDEEQGR